MKDYKNTRKRIGTALLCAVLACAAAPFGALAAIGDGGGGNVCHDGHENCTWVEAVEGHPCGYIADEDEVVTVLQCRHEHDNSCYKESSATPGEAAELNCHHEHDEGCYEVEKASPTNAEQIGGHVHDEECGYVEEVKGVRCNHACEICDELYGELPKVARYARNVVDTGDFAVSEKDDSVNVKFENGLLTLSGSGKVTVGMASGKESTNNGILADGSSGSMTVNLSGISIKSQGAIAPVEIKGSHTVSLNLMADTENHLSIPAVSSALAALKVDKDANLMIGADSSATGSLYAETAGNYGGSAIGSDYSYSGNNVEAGNITIAGGTVVAKSPHTAIGGSGGSAAGTITIGSPGSTVDVTAEGGEVGIGSGNARGSVAGDITITEGAVVAVKVEDGVGIGSGYYGTVGDITINGGAEVTVDATYTGIGSGYDEYTAKAGNIVIDGSKVTIAAEYTGIGNSYGGTAGDITIKDSTLNLTGKSDNIGLSSKGYTAVGNGYEGKVGAISISKSELKLENWAMGVGTPHRDSDKEKDIGTGEIIVADCTIDTTNCTTGIRGELSTIDGSGDIEISGRLKLGQTNGTGISAGGDLNLKSGCELILDTGTSPGISVNGTMDVNAQSKLVLTSKYTGIGGNGNVTFHNGSDVKIVSGSSQAAGAGIELTGKPSTLLFGQGCKVFVNARNGDWPYHTMRNDGGVTTIEPGADVVVTSAMTEDGDGGRISLGTLQGDTCILTAKSPANWAGKTIEIRDKNGKRLNPKVEFKSSENYQILSMIMPGPGDYTIYAGGQPQNYLGGKWHDEPMTVFTVKKGINEIKLTESSVQTVPVTGIRFDDSEKTVSMEPGKRNVVYTLEPLDATNQNVTITSSNPDIVEAQEGPYGGYIILLTAKKAGTAVVTVTTEDGGFSAACTVNVSETAENEYELTVSGSYAFSSGSGSYAPGTRVNIHAGTYTGYTFSKWHTTDRDVTFANANSPDTTFIMPERDVTVRAVWSKNTGDNPSSGGTDGGGSGSGGSDKLPDDEITKQYKGEGTGSSAVWTWRDDGTWTATVGGETPKTKWVCLNNPYAGAGQPKGGWFYFDENGTMKNGWFTDTDSKRYYLEPSPNGIQGMMLVGWHWIDGKCYYFGIGYRGETLGALVTGGKTRDGYEVNAAGEWVVDGVVQTR